MEFFRRLLGLPSQPYNSPDFGYLEDEAPTRVPDSGRNFHVFTDPLQMHRYFEQQMDAMFRSFGMPNFGRFFGALEEPHGDDLHHVEEFDPDSRESFLKKGSEQPSYEYPPASGKADKDLDGKLTLGELDGLLSKPDDPNRTDLKGFGGHRWGSFEKSVEIRTVRRPDGSCETQKIVTDSDGNRETTITKTLGQNGDVKEEERSLFGNILFRPLLDESLFRQFFK